MTLQELERTVFPFGPAEGQGFDAISLCYLERIRRRLQSRRPKARQAAWLEQRLTDYLAHPMIARELREERIERQEGRDLGDVRDWLSF